MKITPYNTPLAPPLRPHFSDALGIHGKLHVMPVAHGMPENGTFTKMEYATRIIERYAFKDVARTILRETLESN